MFYIISGSRNFSLIYVSSLVCPWKNIRDWYIHWLGSSHDDPARLLSPWDSPGKNTGMGCHFLLQGIFLTQGSNLHLLHWQVDFFFTTEPAGKPPVEGNSLVMLVGLGWWQTGMDTDPSKQEAGKIQTKQARGRKLEGSTGDRWHGTGETEQKMEGKGKMRKGQDGKRTPGGLAEWQVPPLMRTEVPR